MRLADDEITVELPHSEVIRLRPSLRAAFRLERRHGGFDKMARAVADGNLGVMADLVREGSAGRSTIPDAEPLRHVFESITGPLLAFVFALAGYDENAKSQGQGERIEFADYHARLYRIATGWIGWSPEDAWNATPAEIIEAYRGRQEMFAALFGSGDKQEDSIDLTNGADETTRALLNSLGRGF